MVPWSRNRSAVLKRLYEVLAHRNIPEDEVTEIIATHSTSFRRILRPFLWSNPSVPWDIAGVLARCTGETVKMCEGVAYATYLLSLHLNEKVDGVLVPAEAYTSPFNTSAMKQIFVSKFQQGDYDNGRQVPASIQEKINCVSLRVFESQCIQMLSAHKRHIKENYYRYYRLSLANFIKERCPSLSRKRLRTASFIISNSCKDRTNDQVLLAKYAVRSRMILSNFTFRQIIVGMEACEEFFWFRSKGGSYAATLQKMRDLRLHSMHTSLTGEGAHFTLLPKYRLQTTFINIDTRTVHQIFGRAARVSRKPPHRGIPMNRDVHSLSIMFGFFADPHIRLPFTEDHHDKRYGIPQFYRHNWAYEKNLDVTIASNPTIPFPTLPTSVMTNGLEAAVRSLTLVPKRGEATGDEEVEEHRDDVHVVGDIMGDTTAGHMIVDEDMLDVSPGSAMSISGDDSESAMSIWEDGDPISSLKHRRSKGAEALMEKGYSSIQDILDPHTDETGIYRGIDSSVPLAAPYRMICVDPGRVQLVSYVSKNIFPGDTSAVFRNVDNPGVHKGSYSTFEYQKGSKLISHYQWEQERRNVNADYNAWILLMSNLSLKKPGGSTAYVDACYANLEVCGNELLRHDRRLRRFRRSKAKKSTLADIAKFIVFGEVLDCSNPTTHHEKKALKRKNDRAINRAKKTGMKRFVAFGDAQFAAGSQGPCPKKILIREIAKLCPVIIIPEWGTSATCHKCHRRIKTFQGRRVICGNDGCDYEGDRDENAGCNMGQIAVNRMQGLPHPPHLTRPARNTNGN